MRMWEPVIVGNSKFHTADEIGREVNLVFILPQENGRQENLAMVWMDLWECLQRCFQKCESGREARKKFLFCVQ